MTRPTEAGSCTARPWEEVDNELPRIGCMSLLDTTVGGKLSSQDMTNNSRFLDILAEDALTALWSIRLRELALVRRIAETSKDALPGSIAARSSIGQR